MSGFMQPDFVVALRARFWGLMILVFQYLFGLRWWFLGDRRIDGMVLCNINKFRLRDRVMGFIGWKLEVALLYGPYWETKRRLGGGW